MRNPLRRKATPPVPEISGHPAHLYTELESTTFARIGEVPPDTKADAILRVEQLVAALPEVDLGTDDALDRHIIGWVTGWCEQVRQHYTDVAEMIQMQVGMSRRDLDGARTQLAQTGRTLAEATLIHRRTSIGLAAHLWPDADDLAETDRPVPVPPNSELYAQIEDEIARVHRDLMAAEAASWPGWDRSEPKQTVAGGSPATPEALNDESAAGGTAPPNDPPGDPRHEPHGDAKGWHGQVDWPRFRP